MKHILLFVIHCSLFIILSGCSGKPADVPKLFPASITVKNGSVPISGAAVILGASGTNSQWTAAGITNSNGYAYIRTGRLGWLGNGVPAGKYTVAVSKTPEAAAGLPPEEFQKLDAAAQEKYRIEQQKKYEAMSREIPVQLSDFTQSPFELTVVEGQENNLEIDISVFKAKKIKK